jgi:hypothetical protein
MPRQKLAANALADLPFDPDLTPQIKAGSQNDHRQHHPEAPSPE